MDRWSSWWIFDRPRTLFPGTALILLLVPNTSHAETWNIQVDGSSDAPTLQAGIDSAASGDTVLVGAGTYFENINFLGKDIVLLSVSGPSKTTIDGSQGNQPVVRFQNQETRAAIIDGFTITGGQGTTDFGSPRGGGIVCIRSSPTVRNNWIIRNESTLSYGTGGGMVVGTGLSDVPRAAPLIESNLFEENVASGNGGALSLLHSDVVVTGNTFRQNSCTYDGGAIRAYFTEGGATIEHNQFFENEAGDHGGGVYAVIYPGAPALVRIEGNLFVRNSSLGSGVGDTGSGGGIYLSAVGSCSNNTLVSNSGLGEVPSSGGGIVLSNVSAGMEFARNILAFNQGSGIACRGSSSGQIGSNLLWQNTVGDIGDPTSPCPLGWISNQVIADPHFCDPSADNFKVASDSPALTGEEVMGAYADPGCGPVPVQSTTWGRLKALYR